jgi:hypothetical protein
VVEPTRPTTPPSECVSFFREPEPPRSSLGSENLGLLRSEAMRLRQKLRARFAKSERRKANFRRRGRSSCTSPRLEGAHRPGPGLVRFVLRITDHRRKWPGGSRGETREPFGQPGVASPPCGRAAVRGRGQRAAAVVLYLFKSHAPKTRCHWRVLFMYLSMLCQPPPPPSHQASCGFL